MEVRLRMGTRDDPTFTGRSESSRWGAWAVGSGFVSMLLTLGLESPTLLASRSLIPAVSI